MQTHGNSQQAIPQQTARDPPHPPPGMGGLHNLEAPFGGARVERQGLSVVSTKDCVLPSLPLAADVFASGQVQFANPQLTARVPPLLGGAGVFGGAARDFAAHA